MYTAYDDNDKIKDQLLSAALSHRLWDGVGRAIDRDYARLVISKMLAGLWNADNSKAATTKNLWQVGTCQTQGNMGKADKNCDSWTI